MSDRVDSGEASTEVPAVPPQPLAAGWYADPQGRDTTALRYWDGAEWTDKTAATSTEKTPTKRPGVRRSVVLWIALIAILAAALIAGLGVWNLSVAQSFQDKTTVIDHQTGTLQEETDELNAS